LFTLYPLGANQNKKAKLLKDSNPSAARPSSTSKTRRFPHPSHKGVGFIGNKLFLKFES
jgi:hypothetical protein